MTMILRTKMRLRLTTRLNNVMRLDGGSSKIIFVEGVR